MERGAFLSDKYSKKPFIVIPFFFFSLFPIVLYFSKSFPLLIIAFIVRGLKEFGEPTRKALIIDLSPDDYKASSFGVYYLIRDFIVSITEFTSSLLWEIHPVKNFFVMGGYGLIDTIFFAVFGKTNETMNSSNVMYGFRKALYKIYNTVFLLDFYPSISCNTAQLCWEYP